MSGLHLEVGPYAVTISGAEFFTDRKGRFKFTGVVDGAVLAVVVEPLGDVAYQVRAEVSNVDLTGAANPLPVHLDIGDDTGSTTTQAKIR